MDRLPLGGRKQKQIDMHFADAGLAFSVRGFSSFSSLGDAQVAGGCSKGGFTPASPWWLQSRIKRDQTRMAAGGS